MNIRPTYLTTTMSALILTFCVGLFSGDAVNVARDVQSKLHVNTSAKKIVGKHIVDRSSNSKTNSQGSGPQIKIAPDLAIQVSSLHSIDRIQFNPEILYVAFRAKYDLKVESPKQLSLLKILFRTAISVNAP